MRSSIKFMKDIQVKLVIKDGDMFTFFSLADPFNPYSLPEQDALRYVSRLYERQLEESFKKGQASVIQNLIKNIETLASKNL